MNIYRVVWTISGGGPYIPVDPGSSGGGGHADLYGCDIITASTGGHRAREAMKLARPKATVRRKVEHLGLA